MWSKHETLFIITSWSAQIWKTDYFAVHCIFSVYLCVHGKETAFVSQIAYKIGTLENFPKFPENTCAGA